jgi:hypothetical protein
VDHFIAWACYPIDLGHNFVLADRSCNNQKRDRLLAFRHLAAWKERNQRYRSQICFLPRRRSCPGTRSAGCIRVATRSVSECQRSADVQRNCFSYRTRGKSEWVHVRWPVRAFSARHFTNGRLTPLASAPGPTPVTISNATAKRPSRRRSGTRLEMDPDRFSMLAGWRPLRRRSLRPKSAPSRLAVDRNPR